MSDVTRILSAIEEGDPSAAEQLLPLVYDELRKLAANQLAKEKPGQTLEVTAAAEAIKSFERRPAEPASRLASHRVRVTPSPGSHRFIYGFRA
jgi:hypothetical protein